MATRFEIAIFGDSPSPAPDEIARLRAAGEDAIAEIRHWHARLSAFDPGSFVSHINAHAAHTPVACDPEFFALLLLCRDVWAASEGAFDAALGTVLHAAGLREAPRAAPTDLAAARAASGFDLVRLDSRALTIAFTRQGVRLDLGAVGKGFALDCAAQRLLQAGVSRALLHGGTSSVLALDGPPHADAPAGYPVALGQTPGSPIITLRANALGVSASRGRTATDTSGAVHGHVLNPSAQGAASAPLDARVAVVASGAALADAWSTAALVLGPGKSEALLRATQPSSTRLIWW